MTIDIRELKRAVVELKKMAEEAGTLPMQKTAAPTTKIQKLDSSKVLDFISFYTR
jgi:hypothetical protein